MLKGKKTYILGALGILTAVAYYLVGDMSAGEAGKVVFEGLLAMFIRNGITAEVAK